MDPNPFTQNYAFTITLKPKCYDTSLRHQLQHTYRSILNRLIGDEEYPHKVTLVAESTKQCNIHYHGIIAFNHWTLRGRRVDVYWYNLWRKHTFVGFTLIKVMENEQGWIEYITKDIDETKDKLSNCHVKPVIQDDHDIQPLPPVAPIAPQPIGEE